MQPKQYLITGGAGFIGSNFIRYLYKQEPTARIRVLDKLTYSGNKTNIEEFMGKDGFEFIHGDIANNTIVKSAMKDVNVVVNFAAEVSVDRSIKRTESFLQTDIYGVYVLLKNALKQRKSIERFIQISTDEVYGEIMSGSFSETAELKPRNPYSAAKAAGERLAYSFYSTYQLPVIITRASNTYGPWAYPEKVIPLFITNLLEGLKVPLFGQGAQIRDWLYVEDHCEAIYMLIKNGVSGEVYNIGGGQECSNLELTKMILEIMGKDESFIQFVADRPGHDFRYSIDCTKIKRLGWAPKYDLRSGLKATVEWYTKKIDWWKELKRNLDKRYIHGFWGEK